MNYENPISPEELKHNTGGRSNGVVSHDITPPLGAGGLGLRSSEVNEVLSQPPSWLVRWGITVFFFVLLILLGRRVVCGIPRFDQSEFARGGYQFS